MNANRREVIIAKLTNNLSSNIKNYPDIFVHDYEQISKDSFKIVFSHMKKYYNEKDYDNAVLSAWNGKFTLVPDTINKFENRSNVVISMIICSNSKSLPYNEDNTKGMKVISANVLMDDEQNIWAVKGEGDSRRIVQTSDDDFESILSSRKAVTASAHSSIKENDINVLNSDFILYYNPENYLVESGFAIHANNNKIYVMNRNTNKWFSIISSQVIDAVDSNSIDEEHKFKIKSEHKNVAFTDSDANKYIEYIRKLYSDHKEFFNAFERAIKTQRTIGNNNTNTITE